jgi:uncharacterized membrane protein YheB (UPF0754 family)
MNPWILFPLIGAVIGYFTNYLAVKMIFRPRSPVLGVQGLIPRRRADLAKSIGETVSTHLITQEDLMKAFPMEEMEEGFTELLGEKVDEFINTKFMALNPMIAAFLTDDLRKKIRDGVIEQMQDILPEMKDKLLAGVAEMDTSKLVAEKIEGFDVRQLEDIILELCRNELRAIEILGGVLGGLIGLLQCYLMSQDFINPP